MPESDIVEPEDELELFMLEPELLGVVDVLPDEVDGGVIVLASVERPVLGVVDIVPEVDPVLGVVDIVPEVDPVLGAVDIVLDPVEPVGAAEPGSVVPVDEGVVAVGLVVEGAVLVLPVLPGDVCAWAMPMPAIRAEIEAAAMRDLENLIIGILLFERLKTLWRAACFLRQRRARPGLRMQQSWCRNQMVDF